MSSWGGEALGAGGRLSPLSLVPSYAQRRDHRGQEKQTGLEKGSKGWHRAMLD